MPQRGAVHDGLTTREQVCGFAIFDGLVDFDGGGPKRERRLAQGPDRRKRNQRSQPEQEVHQLDDDAWRESVDRIQRSPASML